MPIIKRRVYLNGKIVVEDKACVSVFDRGFNYGDGVFETIKAVNGRPAFLEEHTERLKSGVQAIGMTIKSVEGLINDLKTGIVEKLLQRNGVTTGDAYVRITVTRGVGGSGHTPPKTVKPTTVIVTRKLETGPIEMLKKNGVRAVILTGPVPAFPGIKTINFLPNILGKMTALKNRAFEGIFTGEGSTVLEGTSTNVFMVSGGFIKTPPLGEGLTSPVLPGVTRAVVLDIASEEGFKTREEAFTTDELLACDEAFLTNSILEVVPLVKVGATKIGSGGPGKVTGLVQRALKAKLRLTGAYEG